MRLWRNIMCHLTSDLGPSNRLSTDSLQPTTTKIKLKPVTVSNTVYHIIERASQKGKNRQMNKRKASTLSGFRPDRQKNLRRYQANSYGSKNRSGGQDFLTKRARDQPEAFPFLKLPPGKTDTDKISLGATLNLFSL